MRVDIDQRLEDVIVQIRQTFLKAEMHALQSGEREIEVVRPVMGVDEVVKRVYPELAPVSGIVQRIL
jgi:hypothetical protein